MKTYTLNQVQDELIGKIGIPDIGVQKDWRKLKLAKKDFNGFL